MFKPAGPGNDSFLFNSEFPFRRYFPDDGYSARGSKVQNTALSSHGKKTAQKPGPLGSRKPNSLLGPALGRKKQRLRPALFLFLRAGGGEGEIRDGNG